MKLICLSLGLLSVFFLNGSGPRDLKHQQDRIVGLVSVRNVLGCARDAGLGSSLITVATTAIYETTQQVCVAPAGPLYALGVSLFVAVAAGIGEEYVGHRIEKNKKE